MGDTEAAAGFLPKVENAHENPGMALRRVYVGPHRWLASVPWLR